MAAAAGIVPPLERQPSAIEKLATIKVPIQSIYESFICPICLGEITDCHITSCGHNFCEECIRECLNRKHMCPLCQGETTQEKLVKNHHFDNLFQKLKEEKDIAAKAYVNDLVAGAKAVAGVGIEQVEKSPIEAIFMQHVQRTLFAYQDYYNELEQNFKKKQAEDKATVSQQIMILTAQLNVELQVQGLLDGEELQAPPSLVRSQSHERAMNNIQGLVDQFHQREAEQRTRLDKSIALLVASFDSYMKALAPSPFLLPVKVTLVVAHKGVRCDASLRATDTLNDVKPILMDKTANLANPITGFGETVFSLKRPFSGVERSNIPGGPALEESKEEIVDPNATVAELKLQQGTEIIVIGAVFKSDEPVKCFTAIYDKAKDARVDYFRCQTCQYNWVCKACAETCHAGHKVVPFMLDHKPSYACCYCVKRKYCKIENAKSKK